MANDRDYPIADIYNDIYDPTAHKINVAATIGSVTASDNLAQVNGATVNVGVGASGTGTQRVAVASDSTIGLVAGTALVGKVGIDQTTPGTTNKVSIGTDGTVAINAALPAGSNVVGKVGLQVGGADVTTANPVAVQPPASGALSVDLAKVGGVTTSTGNGVAGTGVQRVTIASDNTAFGVNATLSAETTKVIGTVNVAASQTIAVTQATGANLNATVAQGTPANLKMEPTQLTAANLQVTANQSTAANLNATVVQNTPANLKVEPTQLTAANLQVTANQSTAANFNATVVQSTPANLQVQSTIPGTGAATVSSVAASATSVTLLSSNAARKQAIVVNDSTVAKCYLKFGATASTSSYSYVIQPGGTWEQSTSSIIYTGIIDAIWDSASGNARITEI